MNPTSEGFWCNPPPPGTENPEDFQLKPRLQSSPEPKPEPTYHNPSPPRVIDRIDPYLKNPEYLKFERKYSRPRRSRSTSRHRTSRRHRSRSRSRGRHKHRNRRHHSSSRSRSRSRSVSRSRRRRDRHRSRYSRSYSRSRSRSRSYRSSHKKSRRSRSRRRSYSDIKPDIDVKVVRTEGVEQEESEPEEDDKTENTFKNDGSFMEMFKRMQDEVKQKEAEKAAEANKPQLPAFGKRRGGKVLKTGMVQKNKNSGQDEPGDTQDAWTLYMKEVKRYKEACCDDDSKTRLLVK